VPFSFQLDFPFVWAGKSLTFSIFVIMIIICTQQKLASRRKAKEKKILSMQTFYESFEQFFFITQPPSFVWLVKYENYVMYTFVMVGG
jgi:hypothetical protein